MTLTAETATRSPISPPAPAGAPARRRDPLLDLLRAVALARVFVWHTFPAKWLTAFAAMPVMFFVAGTMLPAVTGWRSYATMLRRRGRRLLVPFWAYGIVLWTTVFVLPPGGASTAPAPRWSALTWVVPIGDPTGHSFAGGWLASHLWYLRAYLWLVIAAPVVVALTRRVAAGAIAAAAGFFVLAFAPRFHLPVVGTGSGRVVAGDLVCYGLFAALGVVYARRRVEERAVPAWPVAAAVAARAAAAAAVYVARNGLPAEGVNGSYPAIVLTGIAWLAGLQALEGPLRRLAGRPRVAAGAEAVSGRALTVYLWHPAGIVVARTLLGPTRGLGGATTLAVAAAATLLFVAAFGRLEDHARGPRKHPAPVAAGGAGFSPAAITALVTAVAVAGFAVAQVRPAGASADGTPALGRAGLAPSFRDALRNDAFSTLRTDEGRAAPAEALTLRRSAPATTAPAGTGDPAVLDRPDFQAALTTWFASHPELGTVVVAVDVDGRLWKGEAFRDPAHPHHKVDDTYRVMSLTKTFTTALALQAFERGQLDLDAPVPALDGVTAPAHPVTARQLLTHTSGLVDYTEADGYDRAAPLDAVTAVNLATRSPQRSWPGVAVHYANTNFLYLELVLEKRTGRSFDALMAELIGRVGLRYTRLAEPDRPGWAAGGAGGIRSNVPDLALWVKALFTPGRVVQASTLALLTTLDEHNLGLGTWPICPCWTDETGAHRYTAIGHHVGSGAIEHYPATGIAVAVRIEPQADEDGGLAAELGARISDLVAAERAPVAATTGPTTIGPTTTGPTTGPTTTGPTTGPTETPVR